MLEDTEFTERDEKPFGLRLEPSVSVCLRIDSVSSRLHSPETWGRAKIHLGTPSVYRLIHGPIS